MASKKMVAFLGVADNRKVTYTFEQREWVTELFPVALCHFYPPEELLVLVTPAAKTKWFAPLEQQVQPMGVTATAVDIPEGHSVNDLWTIFALLTKHLNEGDEVYFDITHSFRTLPLLAFLAASYLRVACNVRLRGIYYGAYEARQPLRFPPEPEDRAPVFDLTPFLDLLDWTTATDQFLKTGNAHALAAQLRSNAPDVSHHAALADSIDNIAQGLHLLRPQTVMEEAARLPDCIAAASASLTNATLPLLTLLKRVQEGYGAFGLSDPADYRAHPQACLLRQLEMLRWYVEKEQYVHALSIAREWLCSLLCFYFGLDPFDPPARDRMAKLLNGERMPGYDLNTLPDSRRLKNLWGGNPLKLANLRNDVLHSGFSHNPRSVEDVKALTATALTELEAVAREWKLRAETA